MDNDKINSVFQTQQGRGTYELKVDMAVYTRSVQDQDSQGLSLFFIKLGMQSYKLPSQDYLRYIPHIIVNDIFILIQSYNLKWNPQG